MANCITVLDEILKGRSDKVVNSVYSVLKRMKVIFNPGDYKYDDPRLMRFVLQAVDETVYNEVLGIVLFWLTHPEGAALRKTHP